MIVHHPGALTVLGRAALGPITMALALGIATAVAPVAGDDGFAVRLVPAVLTSLIAVPLIVVLWRRRGGLRGLGLTAGLRGLRGFLLGCVVTAASAAVVFGAGTAAGWLRWNALDPGSLAAFLVTNAIIAFLLEAFPEELALRGHAWSTLRSRFGRWAAAVGTTAMFLATPAMSFLVSAGIEVLAGGSPGAIGLAPAGQDPVSYLILLTVFGIALIAARGATGSLWTSIATHLTFLTVQRIVLDGETRDAGWSAEMATPDALLLVPAYLLLAAVVFVGVRWLTRPAARRDPVSRQAGPGTV
ncbi:CPBP family glutamic-type intramembrane protease [Saccharopolyspora sp. NPDC050389]|uniref:CPBP family glutamic-type intramembrane protease n=1 Tax=Saccharopolyspora sp. NPDC050389 TaxID=3155516 RepID=UPI0033F9FCEA